MDSQKKEINIFSRIKSSILLQILTCIILSSIVIGVFLLLINRFDINDFRKYTLVNDIKLINEIEEIRIEGKSIEIEGYAFRLEHDSKNSSISLFLRNLINGEEVWMDVDSYIRTDVQDYFNCRYNYENSGFIARVLQKKIHIEECYEIIINIDTKNEDSNIIRRTVSTGQYIYEGELLAYNPYEFDYPDTNIQSDLVRKVFTEGKLRLYKKDAGMYVYEFEGRLYWVVTEDFQFNEDGETQVPYHIMTSQVELLPEHRIQYKFDNLGMQFEQHELVEENIAPYRIAVRDIPDEYAITYINTGVYDDLNQKWLWSELFQLGLPSK